MDGKNAKEPNITSKLMESCDYIILTIYQTKMEGLTLIKSKIDFIIYILYSLSNLVPPLMFHLKVVLQNPHKYIEVLDKRRAA